jgi:hydrogenase nickel incorporation protein HypA/HybF
MHELSLAAELVSQVGEIARREGAARIARIEVRIGPLSGVDREAFAFAFPFAAEGSLAEGAALDIEAVPLVVECRACGASTQPEYPIILCAACASGDVAIVSGDDFRIVAMEVD